MMDLLFGPAAFQLVDSLTASTRLKQRGKNSKPAAQHHSFGINRTETGGLSPVVMFTGMPKAS